MYRRSVRWLGPSGRLGPARDVSAAGLSRGVPRRLGPSGRRVRAWIIRSIRTSRAFSVRRGPSWTTHARVGRHRPRAILKGGRYLRCPRTPKGPCGRPQPLPLYRNGAYVCPDDSRGHEDPTCMVETASTRSRQPHSVRATEDACFTQTARASLGSRVLPAPSASPSHDLARSWRRAPRSHERCRTTRAPAARATRRAPRAASGRQPKHEKRAACTLHAFAREDLDPAV